MRHVPRPNAGTFSPDGSITIFLSIWAVLMVEAPVRLHSCLLFQEWHGRRGGNRLMS
jgi:hypothetical protein